MDKVSTAVRIFLVRFIKISLGFFNVAQASSLFIHRQDACATIHLKHRLAHLPIHLLPKSNQLSQLLRVRLSQVRFL